jgi:hypothetical protein
MDNLRIDRNGLVGLIDGHQRISSSSVVATKLHTKIVDGKEYLWSAYGAPVSAVTRTWGLTGVAGVPSGPIVNMVVDGAGVPSAAACFGDAFNETIIISGTLRTKDFISHPPLPLGIETPSLLNDRGPQIHINSQLKINVAPAWVTVTGTKVTGSLFRIDLDDQFFTGAAAGSWPSDLLQVGGSPSSNPPSDIIQFPFSMVTKTADVMKRVVLDFLLDEAGNPDGHTDPLDQTTYRNYYEFEWVGNDLQAGVSGALLSRRRWDATRFGNNSNLDWTKVVGIRFFCVATEDAQIDFGNITIIGGAEGNLDGIYNYIQQDVYDDGTYVAKSPVSALGYDDKSGVGLTDINVKKGSVLIYPVVRDTNNVTAHYFYRRASPDQGIDPDTGESKNPSSLIQYNFVGSSPLSVPFTDSLSDTEVLELNAGGDLLPNLFLQTMVF